MHYNKSEIRDLYLNTDTRTVYDYTVKSSKVKNKINYRLMLILSLFAILAVFIMTRLFWINLVNHDFYTKQSDMRIKRNININAMRGEILDRNNEVLALSAPVASIWCDTDEMTNLSVDNLRVLASKLGISVTELNDKLKKGGNFVYLARSLSPEQTAAVMSLKIPGIYSQKSFKRFYPVGEVAAPLVGSSNIEQNGSSGIEFSKNSELLGQDGNQVYMRGPTGNVIENVEERKDPVNGGNIQLAIDNKIQYIAYKELKNAVTSLGAKSASAVVLDAKTGEVLAMASYPSFNPNVSAPKNQALMKNNSIMELYEPGSTMKPLLISKALDMGLIKSTTIFDTKPYTIDGKLIKDTHLYPNLSVADIVRKSSDVGTSKISFLLDKKDAWGYYDKLGFGHRLTDLAGDSRGYLIDYKKWSKLDQAVMSYGYAINVNLLQMASAYTLFTNNGCLISPSIYKTDTTPSCEQLLSVNTAKTMSDILASVTETGGTGKLATVENYTSAGKTGTAHKSSKKGYAENNYVGSFIGYAPAKNPKIIVAVIVDDPKTAYYGGTVAAPVFSQVVGQSLPYLNVPYDKNT